MNKRIIGIIIGVFLVITAFSINGISDDENDPVSILPEYYDFSVKTKVNNQGVPFLGNDICYCENLHDPTPADFNNLSHFDPLDPGTLTVITASIASDFLAGGCFVKDTWYACEYSAAGTANIWTINETNGAMTLIGVSSAGLNGLAYDDVTDTLFGCSSTSLYIINQTTASTTLIGAMGNSGTMIGIACDSMGNLYGEDLADDNFYSINKTTGSSTVIGPLGIDLNYAQDMAINKNNDTCYITGYKGSANGGGALHTVNLTTGVSTFVGDFPIGMLGVPSEIANLAIPYDLGPQPQNIMFIDLEQKWNIVSLPFNVSIPKANITVNYLGTNYTWGDAVTAGYVSDFVYKWVRFGQYYTIAGDLEPGDGYWLYAYVACDLWVDNITIVPDELVTNVEDKWNIISVPNLMDVNKGNLTVNYLGTDYTWADAVTGGYVSDFVYGWNRPGQYYSLTVDYEPGEGYWLYSYVDCVLKQPI